MGDSDPQAAPARTLEVAEPVPGGALNPVGYLQRLVASGLGDLRAIAQAVRALPEIAEHLARIEPSVASLDKEVVKMRRAVEEIRVDVEGMSGSVGPLDERLREVRESVDKIEPELTHISRAVRPFSRARARLGRAPGEPAAGSG